MEKMAKLKRQVKGAMTYPIITIIIAIIVIAIILVFVIPVFSEMFADFGSTLPAPTIMVVAMSEFVIGNIAHVFKASDHRYSDQESSCGQIYKNYQHNALKRCINS